MIKLLFNPFEKYSELQLISGGILFAAAGSFIAFYFNGRFDGVLDFHCSNNVLLHQPFIDNAINMASLFILLFVAGIIVNKKTRSIDILSTILVARIPFYFLPITNMGGYLKEIEGRIDPSHPEKIMLTRPDIIILLFVGILSVAFLVWSIALLYNGFKVATNIKTTPHKLLFAFTVLLAEILSKILFSAL